MKLKNEYEAKQLNQLLEILNRTKLRRIVKKTDLQSELKISETKLEYLLSILSRCILFRFKYASEGAIILLTPKEKVEEILNMVWWI